LLGSGGMLGEVREGGKGDGRVLCLSFYTPRWQQ